MLKRVSMEIQLYDRETKRLVNENAYKVEGLHFLYHTRRGKMLTGAVLKRRFISATYGRYMKTKASVKKIPDFIKHYQIDLDEVKRPLHSFVSFNDFFIRELKPQARPLDTDPQHLISPADARLLTFRIDENLQLPVKGFWYSLGQLVGDEQLAAQYAGGWCLIYRLAPSDYHRYHYIDDGYQETVTILNGPLHSVNPIALRSVDHILATNYRELTVLHTANFGEVLHIEVGALFVGKVVQGHTGRHEFKRGDEKGWFEFGGSTVIHLFKANTISPDTDILEYSAKGIETLVKVNEKVGQRAD